MAFNEILVQPLLLHAFFSYDKSFYMIWILTQSSIFGSCSDAIEYQGLDLQILLQTQQPPFFPMTTQLPTSERPGIVRYSSTIDTTGAHL